MRNWAALAIMLFALSGAEALAADVAAWREARAARWAAFQTAHGDGAAQVAAVKASTAAMVAAAGPSPYAASAPETAASLTAAARAPRPPAPYPAALDAASVIWRVPGPPLALWDAVEGPEMVVVPAGEFAMGPRRTETGLRNEVARHAVRIDRPFAVAKYPVTVGEFAAFVAETGHDAGNRCWTYEGIVGTIREGRNWRNPGFAQTDADPVLCVSWREVDAYIAWLSQKTGHVYRLLSEAEYEYVDRAGATTTFWWGEDLGSNRANCDGCGSLWDTRSTSPVGSFAPNSFGLYDTAGDTWVWTSDCYVTNPAAAQPPAPAMIADACAEHAIRGGAWHSGANGLRSTARFGHTTDTHSATLGIRLAREL